MKTKIDLKKTIPILTITILLISTIAFIGIPAARANTSITSLVTFREREHPATHGNASWTTDVPVTQPAGVSKPYAVNLTLPIGATGSDAALVKVYYNQPLSTIDSLDNLTYYYCTDKVINTYMVLYLDTDGDGLVDHELDSKKQEPDSVDDGKWHQTKQLDEWQNYTYNPVTDACSDPGDWKTLAERKTQYATAMLVYVAVQLSLGQSASRPYTYFVDDIKVGAVTYGEPQTLTVDTAYDITFPTGNPTGKVELKDIEGTRLGLDYADSVGDMTFFGITPKYGGNFTLSDTGHAQTVSKFISANWNTTAATTFRAEFLPQPSEDLTVSVLHPQQWPTMEPPRSQ